MASLSFIATTKLIELLRAADPDGGMQVRILNATRLAIGTDPINPTRIIDFANEISGPLEKPEHNGFSNQEPVDRPRGVANRLSRKRGVYWFELDGQRTEAHSLKQLLSESLLAMERAKPGTLDKLSRHKGRSKRIVARDRNQLFTNSHLVADYSEVLTEGWYFGTNNSAAETKKWLSDAAACVGGNLENSFKTSLD